jgi:hypothetical protein
LAALLIPARGLQQKRYGNVAISLFSCTVIIAFMVATLFVMFSCFMGEPLGVRLFFLIVPGIVAVAGGTAIVRVLPRRLWRRRSGRRYVSHVVTVSGIALMGVGAFFSVTPLLWDLRAKEIVDVIKICFLCFIAGAYLYHLRGRVEASQPPVPDAPVLYIRPFSDESKPFVMGPQSKYGRFTRSLHSQLSLGWVSITFEEYFKEAVKCMGPLSALGNPEDRLPPDGALRVYEEDAEWTIQIAEMIRRSVCIIMHPGSSLNVKWELQYIRRENLHQKLFVLTRPPARQYRVNWRRYLLLDLGNHGGTAPWCDYAAMFRETGYQLSDDDPGPGAVIGFDENAAGIVLTTNADLPYDFIKPIADWIGIENRRTSGT